MRRGIIEFPAPDDASLLRKDIRAMEAKVFTPGKNHAGYEETELMRLVQEPETVAYPDARTLLGEDESQGGVL